MENLTLDNFFNIKKEVYVESDNIDIHKMITTIGIIDDRVILIDNDNKLTSINIIKFKKSYSKLNKNHEYMYEQYSLLLEKFKELVRRYDAFINQEDNWLCNYLGYITQSDELEECEIFHEYYYYEEYQKITYNTLKEYIDDRFVSNKFSNMSEDYKKSFYNELYTIISNFITKMEDNKINIFSWIREYLV